MFNNGYGVSVIDNGYGADQGLQELAVVHDGQICYSTPITNNVKGWLTPADVRRLTAAVVALPVNSDCTHKRGEEND